MENTEALDALKTLVEAKPDGEVREGQQKAVSEIESSIKNNSHLIVEAPTGVGKTNAYLIPAILSKKQVVVSTATKQLSEQIINDDLPYIKKVFKENDIHNSFSYSLLKGRDNYYCLSKAAENERLDDDQPKLFKDSSDKEPSNPIAKEISRLKAWSLKTTNGDRSEAPETSDKIWSQYSSNNSECPGKSVCPFGDVCFAELARDKAKFSNIVVTNHAIVAQDFNNEEPVLLGDRSVYIFDEIHELDNYFTNAWGTSVTPNNIKDIAKLYKSIDEVPVATITELEEKAKNLELLLSLLDDGLLDDMPYQIEDILKYVNRISMRAAETLAKKVHTDSVNGELFSRIKKRADEMAEATNILLDSKITNVRWLSSISESVKALNAAPLTVGEKLQSALEKRNAVMIGTSATIRVNGGFEIPLHNLGFDNVHNVKALAVSSPFDLKKQAMLYIPDPNAFPEPVGADRKQHGEAVKATARELIAASGGRALVLSTTTQGANALAEYLRSNLKGINILLQGEKPQTQLVDEFKNNEESVLVGTMGLWHGLNVPGNSLSLVIIDKIPFKPMDDPLSLARQRYAESKGRNGFMDVYVADANVMLTQGFGRLIRSKDDKGVVAILDTRLITKKYGESMRRSIPPVNLYHNKDLITSALERLIQKYKS